MTEPKTFVVSGGGTGGHLFPAIATGQELIGRGHKVHLITDQRCAKYLHQNLLLSPHVLNIQMKNKLVAVYTLLLALFNSLSLLLKIKPECVIGFGGYPSFPTLLASIMLRIPIIIHEQNCLMGKTNRFFARFAKKIALSYPDTIKSFTQKHKSVLVGDIIREEINNLPLKKDFTNPAFRIFIFGGSQGAKIFSSLVPDAIKLLKTSSPDVQIHITQQCSKSEHYYLEKIYNNLNISHQLSEFFHDIHLIYQDSELVISRAGASTIAELSYIGLPAIFIPYPHASENHQLHNALALEQEQAGWCFEQNSVSPEILSSLLLKLINDRALLKTVSNNLLKRKKNGRKLLANTVEEIIN